jgi:hypothetical protein
MTRDQQLETAIHELTQLQIVCGQYGDLETARIAQDAVRALHKRRSSQQVVELETRKGLVRS